MLPSHLNNKGLLSRHHKACHRAFFRTMYMRNWIIAHFVGAVAVVSMGGCDDEPIPAYANVDAFVLNVNAGQGAGTHGITDGWLYIDEQLVGAFEIPFEVPAMANGEHTVRIRPGIKLNGLQSQRTPHPFLNDYIITTGLWPDSTTYFHPVTSYRDGITFAVSEEFNGIGSSIKSTTYSLHDFQRVDDTLLFPVNEVLRMYLNTGEVGYGECESQNIYDLPKVGRTVLLEFDYRCNTALSAGIFVYQSGGGVDDIPIVTLYPTTEWKHVVVNLTENVSYNVNSIGQSLLFRISANGDQTEVQEAFIDNITLAF